MTRKNTAPKLLAAENAAITQFLFDETEPMKKAKIPLYIFFERYQDWRKRNKFVPTKLTIDGFGRLFPHAFPRKSAYWPAVKRSLKCVFNLVPKGT
jgi:hypothetical protein